MVDTFATPERPFGAVKKTEEELQAVPIPRRQSSSAALPQQQQAQPNVTNEGSYERDILADSPLATLPVDVQNNLTKAKLWYEIAMHPASGPFERTLAMAHLDDMDVSQEDDKKEKDDSGKST